jgi:hypothetical protein
VITQDRRSTTLDDSSRRNQGGPWPAVQLDPLEAVGLTGPWRRSGRGQPQADPEDHAAPLTRAAWTPWELPGGQPQRRLLVTGAVVFAAAERNSLCADLVGCFRYVREGR